MRRPVEHEVRQDEMRRAEAVRVESEPRGEIERTIADDCKAMLDAWFAGMARNGKALVLEAEVEKLGRRMIALGYMARYPQAARKL